MSTLTKAAAQRLIRKINGDTRVFVDDAVAGTWMCDRYAIFDPRIVLGPDGKNLDWMGSWDVTTKGIIKSETPVPDMGSIIARAATCVQATAPVKYNGRLMTLHARVGGEAQAPVVLFADSNKRFEVALAADRITLVCGEDWVDALSHGVVVYVDDLHPETSPACIKRDGIVIGYLMPTRLS